MGNYIAYNAGLEGFRSGLSNAKSYRAAEQKEEGQKALSGMLQNELSTAAPGLQIPEALQHIPPDQIISLLNYHKGLAKEVEAKEQKELDNTVSMFSKGLEVLKTAKGAPQKHIAIKLIGSVIPKLQSKGYFKDIDMAELEKKISTADEGDVSKLFKDLYEIDKARQNGGISTKEAHDMANQIMVKAQETLESSEDKKAFTDELKVFREGLEPKKETPERLYSTQKGYLPADQARGQMPYREPKEPKVEKPAMSEAEARKELLALEKWKVQLNRTGGMNEVVFAMLAEKNPEMANNLQGMDKASANKYIDEYANYLRGFIRSGRQQAGSGPPPGFKDTGKTSGGKKVYTNGKVAWVEP